MDSAILISFLILGSALAQDSGPRPCGKTCDDRECQELPVNCPIGITKDNCKCCYQCSRMEGERCDDTPGIEQYGSCGDEMICSQRTDLAHTDLPESLCYCNKTEPVCANDGRTYKTICKFNEARYRERNGLGMVGYGPCPSVPVIVSKPEDVRARSGSNVVLICEASGNPVPQIEWTVVKDGQEEPSSALPRDDQHTAVQSRGGPNPYEVTGWLQLRTITTEDSGRYSCVAINSIGRSSASSTVDVQVSDDDDDDVEANDNQL